MYIYIHLKKPHLFQESDLDTKEGALAFKVLSSDQTKELEELGVEEMQM